MSRVRQILIGTALITAMTLTAAGQSGPPGQRGTPRSPPVSSAQPRTADSNTAPQASGRSFLTQGKAYLGEGRLQEAKEAFRTALRLEPMNPEIWSQYDSAVELDYIQRAREEKRAAVFERDLQPLFSLESVESFREFGNLILVGEVRNVSRETRQNIELVGTLLDENKQELRREFGTLQIRGRGLFPNESSLFEIPFRDPPPGVKSFRVRVSGYE